MTAARVRVEAAARAEAVPPGPAGASPGAGSTTVSRPAAEPIRIGIIEDHALVREGLRLVLEGEPGLVVVGEADSAPAAFELLAARPTVLLVDITLPDADGIALMRALVARRPEVRIIALTMHRDAETVRQALLAGARGYVVKGARSTELIDAIRAVVRGERYLHSSVTGVIVDDSIRWLQSGGGLSAREREVLSLLAAGNSSTSVARLLGISPHTVRRHVANLSGKLKVRGIAGLTRYATQHGLVRDGD